MAIAIALPMKAHSLPELPLASLTFSLELTQSVAHGLSVAMGNQSAMDLTSTEIDRIIQMAWEDRTSFDAIRNQFGLTPGEVIALMRRELKPSSFRLWRTRTVGRKTKHVALRGYKVGRFRSSNQRG